MPAPPTSNILLAILTAILSSSLVAAYFDFWARRSNHLYEARFDAICSIYADLAATADSLELNVNRVFDGTPEERLQHLREHMIALHRNVRRNRLLLNRYIAISLDAFLKEAMTIQHAIRRNPPGPRFTDKSLQTWEQMILPALEQARTLMGEIEEMTRTELHVTD